jgi:hypothetical protein
MKTRFSILFRLLIYHSYFKDGTCNCIRFSPGPLTRQLLKRYNYHFAATGNMFELFGPPAQLSFFEYIKKTTGIGHFDIELGITDADFYHFTKLPLELRREFIYDTQTGTNYFDRDSLHLREMTGDKGTNRFAVVNIQFDDIIKYNNSRSSAQFAIDLAARATQWQYFIVNTSGTLLENPVIKKDDLQFRGPEKVGMKNGQQALFFSSGDHLLALQQIPSYRFSLSSHGNVDSSVPKTIIKTLPCPRPSHFDMIDMHGTKEMASPMYVFI